MADGVLANLDAIGGGLLAGPNAAIQTFLGGGGGGLNGALTENQAAKLAMEQEAVEKADEASTLLGQTLVPILNEIGTPKAKILAEAFTKNPRAAFEAVGGSKGFSALLGQLGDEQALKQEMDSRTGLRDLLNNPEFLAKSQVEQFIDVQGMLGPKQSEHAKRIVEGLQEGKNAGVFDPEDRRAERTRIAGAFAKTKDNLSSYYGLKNALTSPEISRPKDIASVVVFLNTIEPGSIAREAEQTQVKAGGSISESFARQLNEFLSGELLGDEYAQRRGEILAAAKDIVAGRVAIQKRVDDAERNYLKVGAASDAEVQAILGGNTVTAKDLREFDLDLPEGNFTFEGVVE